MMEFEHRYGDDSTMKSSNSQLLSDANKSPVLAPPSSDDELADNLVELVDYLIWSEKTLNPNPEWAKFDTPTTMSDNKGGVIKF